MSKGIIMPKKPTYEELFEKLKTKVVQLDQMKAHLITMENQLRLITNNAKDIIFRFSISQNKFEFLNQATYNILGYSPEDFYGNTKLFSDLVLDEWKESVHKNWDNLIKNLKAQSIEYQVSTKRGDIIWIYQNCNTIVDLKGNPVAIEGIMRNITYRKQAELSLKRKNIEYLSLNEEYLETNEELRNSNKELIEKNAELKRSEIRFRSLFENMSNNVAIFEVHDGKKFIFKNFNSAAEKLENVNRKDIIGKEAAVVFPLIDEFKLNDSFKSVWNTGKPKHHPIIVKDKFGELLSWTENFIYKLPSNEIVVIYDDITKRKKAEIDLIKTKERYQIATEETKVAVWERNLETSVGHADSVLFDILGYPIPDVLDSFSVWRKHIHPEDFKQIQKLNSDLMDGKIKELNFKFRAKHKDGSVRWFLDKGVALRNKKAEAIRLIGTISDITQQQKIEEELILSKEKAVEADNLKSTFLANMSHEIRTPMNGILGFSDLLKSEDSSVEERAHYVDIIHQSGKQLMNIINDILDISKIEVGQIQINEHNTSVNAIINELLILFKPEISDKKNINLEIHKELTDKQAVILTDGLRLRQILNNLINNAIKFTKEGYVEFGYMLIPEHKYKGKNSEAFLQFYVKDTGIGIPQNKREIIFDRFRQSDESHTRKFGGTGLGLAISKGFVELLGGIIWHESTENKGSTFYFTIPYKLGDSYKVKKIDHANINKYSWKKYNVLIVEDDDISFIYMDKLLERTGLKVQRVTKGFEAIEFCKKNKNIDLILMDIQLPGINGYEATRKIRKFLPNVPIIAQTAHALAEDKTKSLESGCNEFITKPIKRQILLKTLEKYFDK